VRIFYITSVLGDVGGSEIYCRDLIKEMLNRGHEVFVFSTTDYKMQGAQNYNCRVFFHHAFHKWQGLLYIKKAVQLAREFKPDIVQSHSNSMIGMIGDAVARELKIPHVLLIELISGKNKGAHTKTIFAWEKFFLPRVKFDRLVVWTENMKQKYCIPWGIAEEKIIVMPAALDEKNYRTAAMGANCNAIKQKFGEHLITSIKGLWGTNAKGLEYVVKAMKFVKQKHADYKYVIFGWGNRAKELQALAEREGVADVVVLAGGTRPEQNEAIAAATEIAPHSYVYEFSTSISLLEYMAWGKAMVVTDVGAVKEFVQDAALVVEAENPQAIAEGIMRLIEDKRLREELEKRARKLFLEKYSIKASVGKLEEIYRGLLKNAE